MITRLLQILKSNVSSWTEVMSNRSTQSRLVFDGPVAAQLFKLLPVAPCCVSNLKCVPPWGGMDCILEIFHSASCRYGDLKVVFVSSSCSPLHCEILRYSQKWKDCCPLHRPWSQSRGDPGEGTQGRCLHVMFYLRPCDLFPLFSPWCRLPRLINVKVLYCSV